MCHSNRTAFPERRKSGKGRNFEAAVLCRASTDDGFRRWAGRDLPVEDCVKIAKQSQPRGWNPARPGSEIARDFYRCVYQRLGEAFRGSLRLYVATDTPLDFIYHADFFLECCGVVVTFDLTTRPWKRRSSDREKAADFLLRACDKGIGALCKLAKRVAESINARISNASASAVA